MVCSHPTSAHKLVVEKLQEIAVRQKTKDRDPERDHIEADNLLLAYINSDEIIEAFLDITKWYS